MVLGRAGAIAILVCSVGCSTGGPSDTGRIEGDAGPEGGHEVILDGGGGIPDPPDGQAACPSGACNYQAQTGCAPGETCEPALNGNMAAPACLPAGAAPSGATCTTASDCAPGLVCVAKACHKLCCGGDWTGCGTDAEHCLVGLAYSDGNGGTIDTGAMLCWPVNVCDALVPDSCDDPAEECKLADPTGATACLPAGGGGAGDPCPCKGGFVCVGEGVGVCHRLCKAVPGGAEPYCTDAEGACVHFDRDPPDVGECEGP